MLENNSSGNFHFIFLRKWRHSWHAFKSLPLRACDDDDDDDDNGRDGDDDDDDVGGDDDDG